jgi:membrane-associated phospholipid phosphatase
MVVLLFCSGFISILLAKVGAHLFNDQRPYISDGTAPLFPHSGDPNGFPSDHTLLSALLAFTALYYSRPAGIFLLVVAAFIGVARVAAHVHHAVDIIGSFVITGIAYLIVIYLIKNRSAAQKKRARLKNLAPWSFTFIIKYCCLSLAENRRGRQDRQFPFLLFCNRCQILQ